MNPILSLLGGATGGGYAKIMMQAVGAAMRGESPEAFMKGLAQTRPELQGLDLTNLESTANTLAQKQGKDINALKGQVQSEIRKYM